MSSTRELENVLRDLPRAGTLIKGRSNRQVWRFEHASRAYYLKFYPRNAGRVKRMFRGNPAMREFTRLQWLQKAGVPSPRAVAMLAGFRIADEAGDAVVIEGIEPGLPLDRYLIDFELRGEKPANYRDLVAQVIQIVQTLGRAGYGHSDLHLGNFLLSGGKLFLLDAYAVHRGMKERDVLMLGHSAARFATTTDLLRGWRAFGGEILPMKNRVASTLFRKFLLTTRGENEYFGNFCADDGWRGHFFKQYKFPKRWSNVSRMQIATLDWQREWPNLLARIESDQLAIIKRSASGDVLEGEVVLGGLPVQVIVKRARKKYLYRYFTVLVRASRSQRIWTKAWKVIMRNIPCEWPLLVMEKRKFGYVTDSLIVLERMQGPTLAKMDLGAMEPAGRELMFRRIGRVLRKLERLGFSHFDAKAANWIIRGDERTGPTPILIDIDGVRHYVYTALGIERILRSMKEHPQYTPADSLALCQGYAPHARIVREEAQGQTSGDPMVR